MTEQDAFAAAIRAAPHDNTARLVFADWLADRSNPMAGCIRLAVRLRANYGPLHPDHSRSFWQTIGRGIEPGWWVEEAGRLVEEMYEKVGDGGKTAVLIALALAEARLLFANTREAGGAVSLQHAATLAVEAVSQLYVPTTSREELSRCLRTAALGTEIIDTALMSAFAQAGRDGCLTIVSGPVAPTPHVEVTVQQGLHFPLAGLDEQEGRELHRVAVLVSLRPLRVAEVRQALTISSRENTALLCCCPSLDPEVAELLRSPGSGEQTILCCTSVGHWRESFEDMAAATGARLISPDQGPVKITPNHLGRAGSACVAGGVLIIEQPAGPPSGVQSWADRLRELCWNTTGKEQERYSERLAQLAGGVVSVEVSGSSIAETEQLVGRAECSLHSGRAVIAEGYVPGGGVAYLRAASHFNGRGGEVLRWALEEPIRALLAGTALDRESTLVSLRCDENLGLNVVREELAPWRSDGPINPLREVRTVIECAFASADRALASGQSTSS